MSRPKLTLTKTGFQQWLAKISPNRVFVCRDQGRCVLAVYIAETNPQVQRVVIGVGNVWLENSRGTLRARASQPWMRGVVDAFDRLGGLGHRVSAAKVREALAEVLR